MVRRTNGFIPPSAWNFASIGLMIFLSCSGISIVRTKQYQLEIAEYKLAVGSALSEVKKEVSDTLEKTAKTPAIAPEQKREIEQLTEKTNAVIEKVAEDIEGKSEKLLTEETEE